ncbi:MAG: DnaJ domain-containing protein [Acidobacteria bacterium]|nr:DnaJ domain-containing protein [Acidobacteriota bacterium]
MADNGKLTRILLDVHRKGRSGVLRFERGKEKKQLVTVRGALAFAESSLPGEHLTAIMVAQGTLPRPALKDVASLMKGGRGLEEALLSLVGAPEVEKGRREQALAVLASLWAWKDPLLHFYAGEGLLPGRGNLSLSLPEALAASARRAVSGRLVPFPAGFAEGGWVLAGEGAGELPLDRGEAAALALLARPRSTADLLRLVNAGARKPEEVVLGLALLGLARFRPAAEPAPEPPVPVPVPEKTPSPARELEEVERRSAGGTFYDVLGVPPEAGLEVIREAYYALARRCHPDRFQSGEHAPAVRAAAQEAFASINEAWLTLKDPDARAGYDRTLSSGAGGEKKAGNAEDEKTAETLFLSGRALIARGEFEQAAERLKGSVWLRPDKAVYRLNLGVAESHLPRRRKSAEEHLLKAVELDPFLMESRLELARLYLEAGLSRKAEAQIGEVLRWDPENRQAHRLRDGLRALPR